jgi:hypothetical protein
MLGENRTVGPINGLRDRSQYGGRELFAVNPDIPSNLPWQPISLPWNNDKKNDSVRIAGDRAVLVH